MLSFLEITLVSSALFKIVCAEGVFTSPSGTDGSTTYDIGQRVKITWSGISEYAIFSLGVYSTSNDTASWLISNSETYPTSFEWTVDVDQLGFRLADSRLFTLYACNGSYFDNSSFTLPFTSVYFNVQGSSSDHSSDASASTSTSTLTSISPNTATATATVTNTDSSQSSTSTPSPSEPSSGHTSSPLLFIIIIVLLVIIIIASLAACIILRRRRRRGRGSRIIPGPATTDASATPHQQQREQLLSSPPGGTTSSELEATAMSPTPNPTQQPVYGDYYAVKMPSTTTTTTTTTTNAISQQNPQVHEIASTPPPPTTAVPNNHDHDVPLIELPDSRRVMYR